MFVGPNKLCQSARKILETINNCNLPTRTYTRTVYLVNASACAALTVRCTKNKFQAPEKKVAEETFLNPFVLAFHNGDDAQEGVGMPTAVAAADYWNMQRVERVPDLSSLHSLHKRRRSRGKYH